MNRVEPAWKRQAGQDGKSEDPVVLHRVWLLPAAVVADIAVQGEVRPEYRAPVAELLRAVGDAAARVGHPAPVLGILRPKGAEAPKKRQEAGKDAPPWKKRQEAEGVNWNTDQDWNRGDFVVEVAPSDEEATRRTEEIARPIRPGTLEVERIRETRTRDDFIERIEELANQQADEATRALLHGVAEGLRQGDVEASVTTWLEAWLKEAKKAADSAREQQEAESEVDDG